MYEGSEDIYDDVTSSHNFLYQDLALQIPMTYAIKYTSVQNDF